MTDYETVVEFCRQRLGRIPDWDSPRGYDEKIQWLKLWDRTPQHVVCCDKLAVREYVRERINEEISLPVYATAPSARRLMADSWPRFLPDHVDRCVLKPNHDSGSVTFVDRRDSTDAIRRKALFLDRMLARPYSVEKGEWAYAQIDPRMVLVEQRLPAPAVDYHFHCVLGEVRWGQVVWDEPVKSECLTDPDGNPIRRRLGMHRRGEPDYPRTPGWPVLKEIAETLSQGWRYVRIDLRWAWDRPWFGEMTFWPRAGACRSPDDAWLGDLLDFPLAPGIHR